MWGSVWCFGLVVMLICRHVTILRDFLVLAVGFVAFRMPSFGFSHPGLLSISGDSASFEGIQGLVSCTRYVHDHVVCVCCCLQEALGFWNFYV